MSEKMLEHKVEAPKVSGITTINHEARVFLGLNCSEYVMMNYIYQCAKNRTPLEISRTYEKTGFTEEEQVSVTRGLANKGFLIITSKPVPIITSKWASGFANLEDEFEKEFWTKNGKVVWTGSSKKQSFKFYEEARKKYPKETIIKGMDEYLEYLSWEHKRGFDRAIMGAEKFLNLKNEYFLVDWKVKSDEIKNKLNPPKVEPKGQLTKEERNKAYNE